MSEPWNTVSAGPPAAAWLCLTTHGAKDAGGGDGAGQTDGRTDAGRSGKRSRAAFKDQPVLPIDRREEVWTEHAPAGKRAFHPCPPSFRKREAPLNKGRNGEQYALLKPKFNLSRSIDLSIGPVHRQNLADGPVGGFSPGFCCRKHDIQSLFSHCRVYKYQCLR